MYVVQAANQAVHQGKAAPYGRYPYAPLLTAHVVWVRPSPEDPPCVLGPKEERDRARDKQLWSIVYRVYLEYM